MRLSLVLKVSALLFFTGSCKEADDKKETMLKEDTVVAVPSPAGQNSSLPFLVSNGEKTMMSWVATENDSVYILKYAQTLHTTNKHHLCVTNRQVRRHWASVVNKTSACSKGDQP